MKSDKDDVLSGVPQGTVLGPLLFLTYINDMPSHTEYDIRLFADDILLYREIRNTNDSIVSRRSKCTGELGKEMAHEIQPIKM
jgi:hypothetical protein